MEGGDLKFRLRLTLAVFLLAVGSPAAQAGLIAYYPFEGNANDASGHGLHGTVVGTLSVVAGHDGLAYAFNGGENYVNVPININPSNYPALTMGAWVKAGAGALGAIRGIISHDNGGFDRTLDIDTRYGGTKWCAFAGGLICGSDVIADTWTFLAVRYNQATGEVALTVDGTT